MNLIYKACDFNKHCRSVQGPKRSFLHAGAFFLGLVLLVARVEAELGADSYQRLQARAEPVAGVDFQARGADLELNGVQLAGNFSVRCLLTGDCLIRSLEGKFSDFLTQTPDAEFIDELQLLPVGASFVFHLN